MDADWKLWVFTLEVSSYGEESGAQTITSPSDQQKSVPIVTIESFYNSHAEKLQMKLEGAPCGVSSKNSGADYQ